MGLSGRSSGNTRPPFCDLFKLVENSPSAKLPGFSTSPGCSSAAVFAVWARRGCARRLGPGREEAKGFGMFFLGFVGCTLVFISTIFVWVFLGLGLNLIAGPFVYCFSRWQDVICLCIFLHMSGAFQMQISDAGQHVEILAVFTTNASPNQSITGWWFGCHF